MRVIISNHAHDRLRERTNINIGKYQKVAEKAWRSNTKHFKRLSCKLYLKRFRDDNSSIIKGHNGNIFVFKVLQNRDGEVVIVLVTIF